MRAICSIRFQTRCVFADPGTLAVSACVGTLCPLVNSS